MDNLDKRIIGARFPSGVQIFFSLQGLGSIRRANPRTLGPCPGMKRPGREAENHPHTVPKLRVHGTVYQLRHTFIWCCAERKQMNSLRSSLFWDVTQRRLVVSHRLFGATYRSHLQGPSSRSRMPGTIWYAVLPAFFLDWLTLKDETYRLSRNVGN